MINTILVEDDLYIQKHFVDRLAADGEFHLAGVSRDAFEAEKHCGYLACRSRGFAKIQIRRSRQPVV